MATSNEFAPHRLHGSFIPPMALDFRSETPLYRQISIWFQRAILDGRLQPGQRVPSTRALARALKISRIPVLSAYELLIAEGYFQSFAGAGTCVSESVPDPFSRPEREELPDAVRTAPAPAAKRLLSRRAVAMRGPAQAWLQRCGGTNDIEHFPIGIWAKLVSRYTQRRSPDTMGYGSTMGYGPLREALAEYLGAFRAVKCEPSQIMVTTGSQQALQISALALLDPNDEAWMEEPGWPGTHQALKVAGARLVPVPVDEQGIDVGFGIRTANHARVAYVTPSHQFPLGVTMSAARRVELLNWAARNGGWIVEDDYDSEYRFSGNPIATLQGLDTDGRVVYVGTLTKVMFPGLRLGFAVIPPDLVETFADIRNAIDTVSISAPHQMAMTDFIREGHFSRHIKRMRAVYMERRKVLDETIRREAGGILEVVGDEAGMYLVALLPPGICDVEIADRAAQMNLRVRELSRCYARPPARGGLMLGYANVGVRDLPAVAGALISIIRNSMRRH